MQAYQFLAAFLMFLCILCFGNITSAAEFIYPENPSDNAVIIDNDGYTINGKRYEFKNKDDFVFLYGGRNDTEGGIVSGNTVNISDVKDINLALIQGGYSL